MIRFTIAAVLFLSLSLQAEEIRLPETTFATFSVLSTATATDSGIILSDPVINLYEGKVVTISFLLEEKVVTLTTKVSKGKVLLNVATNDLESFFHIANDWRIVEVPTSTDPIAGNF